MCSKCIILINIFTPCHTESQNLYVLAVILYNFKLFMRSNHATSGISWLRSHAGVYHYPTSDKLVGEFRITIGSYRSRDDMGYSYAKSQSNLY